MELRAQIAGELAVHGKMSTKAVCEAVDRHRDVVMPALQEMLDKGSVLTE